MERTGGSNTGVNIISGLWACDLLKENIEGSASGVKLTVDKVNRMVAVTAPTGWKVSIMDGLLTVLGLDHDGLGEV